MNRPTAETVSSLMLRIAAELNASVEIVQSGSSEEEFNRYRRAIGVMMGEMLLEIMNPLYAEHPDLKPNELA